ncbi:MAG TPA: DUF3341 domain-containing protein [Polyangiaceae bacterium]|jgi:hypothetical protein
MKKAVVGIVQTVTQADSLVARLQRSGFTSSDISVLLPNTTGTADFAHEHRTKAPEGAAGGASMGGVVGGTIGLLAGVGALAIPGLGPFIAAGPLMATLSGMAAGATVGGLTGALIGLGLPEYEAKIYDARIRGGNILVAVHTEDAQMRQRAQKLLEAAGARDVSAVSESAPHVKRNPDPRAR